MDTIRKLLDYYLHLSYWIIIINGHHQKVTGLLSTLMDTIRKLPESYWIIIYINGHHQKVTGLLSTLMDTIRKLLDYYLR